MKATDVHFDRHRWYVRITVVSEEGTEAVYMASADSALTDSDGIWFGTAQEYDEAVKDAW